ncbi:TPA: Fic family protein [Pseudomonas aeruginosa]|uniref:Fic family protein n=1 Tax=Pseudomonas aeruginosa TaxID=287 RepID=UPI000BB909F2|nr:Fic family protein [Pseudomonas aeruginosa]MDJ1398747.1 Fic family protein [Pseudomonas aeruginosa]MDU0689595.1 Fic family protein [Pseudomonas aeruginosa]PBX15438.1 cell filamentation protein Fic [Pseudomonas aeruginosa]HBP5599365.1 Fic family protein [Pseudomonas aeruginosa]HCF1603719.1 Fic family protein [Pseudomonas aeruginosa]
MNEPFWIWQQPDWPHFNWQAEPLAPLLRACTQAQGRLLGMLGAVGSDTETQSSLDALLENIVTSSAIEGEQLNVGSVRSSLARRLGINEEGRVNVRSEGLAELQLDATSAHEQPLDLQRLYRWHCWLFPSDDNLLTRPLRVGTLRGEEPMQVVSGRLDRPTVHFEAPPRQGLEEQLADFLTWFESSRSDAGLDPLLRAGIAHFWFVTLHPFVDGNGRLTRAITDMALAQGEHQAIRFYAMSASILDDRADYYRFLETSQKGSLDITAWLQWFLGTLLKSLEQALGRIDRVLAKARFWQAHSTDSLPPEQIKMLNRLLDGGEKGFEAGISAAQYQAVAQVSKATATRHLSDLLEKGCLRRLPGGGRSTRYQINQPGSSLPGLDIE